jgi:DUF971 family protein
MKPHPTNIQADRTARRLTITWNDDHTTSYPFDGLRLACPCVECKGGHAKMGHVTPPSVVQNAPNLGIQLEDLQAVGSYALQPLWSDGHSTGMYTWELLRALDPAGSAES